MTTAAHILHLCELYGLRPGQLQHVVFSGAQTATDNAASFQVPLPKSSHFLLTRLELSGRASDGSMGTVDAVVRLDFGGFSEDAENARIAFHQPLNLLKRINGSRTFLVDVSSLPADVTQVICQAEGFMVVGGIPETAEINETRIVGWDVILEPPVLSLEDLVTTNWTIPSGSEIDAEFMEVHRRRTETNDPITRPLYDFTLIATVALPAASYNDNLASSSIPFPGEPSQGCTYEYMVRILYAGGRVGAFSNVENVSIPAS